MKEAENHAMPQRDSSPTWMSLLINHFPTSGDFYSITAYQRWYNDGAKTSLWEGQYLNYLRNENHVRVESRTLYRSRQWNQNEYSYSGDLNNGVVMEVGIIEDQCTRTRTLNIPRSTVSRPSRIVLREFGWVVANG